MHNLELYIKQKLLKDSIWVEMLRFQLNGKYLTNGKTSAILVWVSSQELHGGELTPNC